MRHLIGPGGVACGLGAGDPTLEVTENPNAVDCPFCVEEAAEGRVRVHAREYLVFDSGGGSVSVRWPDGRRVVRDGTGRGVDDFDFDDGSGPLYGWADDALLAAFGAGLGDLHEYVVAEVTNYLRHGPERTVHVRADGTTREEPRARVHAEGTGESADGVDALAWLLAHPLDHVRLVGEALRDVAEAAKRAVESADGGA